MLTIDNNLIDDLQNKARTSERKRMNFDLRTSANDNSQRMLNALLPGTEVPIHRHPMSNENVLLLQGRLVEVLYSLTPSPSPEGEGRLVEIERYFLDPKEGRFGCVVPAGVWHTVEVLEPSVIYEAKDGAYGQDGSEVYDPMKKLKEQITYLIGMERQSGSMDNPSALYISRMLNVPLKEVERAMKEMGV